MAAKKRSRETTLDDVLEAVQAIEVEDAGGGAAMALLEGDIGRHLDRLGARIDRLEASLKIGTEQIAKVANIHLLRFDQSGKPLVLPADCDPPPRGGFDLTRVPCVGEFIRFPDSDEPPYRVTKVQHYPIGMGGCDAEVWCVVDESQPQ